MAAADLASNVDRGRKIGLTEQQKSRLRRVAEEGEENLGSFTHTTGEKMIAVLSAAQQQKLGEELDRCGGLGAARSAVTPRPERSAGQPALATPAVEPRKRPPTNPALGRGDALKAADGSAQQSDYARAIADYTEAIRLNPKEAGNTTTAA